MDTPHISSPLIFRLFYGALEQKNTSMRIIELASSAQSLYIRPPVTQALECFDKKDQSFLTTLNSATARMAKLVDAWDLKSPVRKDVPVRLRVRAPNKSRACMRFFMRAFFFQKFKGRNFLLHPHTACRISSPIRSSANGQFYPNDWLSPAK